jgi:TetR/AcrR family transcriptional regulator, regulator of autoinduction and epiphytic fitness
MVDIRSSKRPYNSSRRQESARLTRQTIAGAALQLFNQRGYRGASIDAIAEAAAVAPETIYATFGSKRELLHYLLDISVGGDEEPVRLIDRPEHQAMLRETDARRLLAGFAAGIFPIMARAAPVFAILTEAAKTEPQLADLLNRIRAERLENMRLVARALAKLETMRVVEVQAAETLWALTSPELFILLTGAHLWSREQYTAWLQDSLTRVLFQDK